MVETAVAPFRWTRSAYASAAAAGAFAGRRVELLGGEVFEMAPEGAAHVFHVQGLAEVLAASLPPGAGHVREAHPVALPPYGEPEPDVALVTGSKRDYAIEHPTAAQILLLVEVSDTTAAFDLGRKAQEYAAAGIGHYWVLLLRERSLVTLADPVRVPLTRRNRVGWAYRRQERWSIGQAVVPPVAGARPIAVADLLPLAPRG